jgi:hypothetical protein
MCRVHFVGGPLSGSPAVMSGLAEITDPPPVMVTRHPYLGVQALMGVLNQHAECITRGRSDEIAATLPVSPSYFSSLSQSFDRKCFWGIPVGSSSH